MIKAIEFPNKTFATKEDLFRELKANEKRIIELKKAQIYKSCEKGQISFLNFNKSLGDATKSIVGAKEGYIYPIISTTKYFDSHGDVHFDGCFTKTSKDQQGNICYALDHEVKFSTVIAWKENVKMFVQNIDWSLVGKNYPGQTQALIFEIKKDDIRLKDVLSEIETRVVGFENSIKMSYIILKLGVNSNDKDFIENKAYYDSKILTIANSDKVAETGYFWGVEELKIVQEGSLVSAGGSNDATSIYQKHTEPSDDTHKEEPVITTQKTIDYNYLSNNLK